MDWNGVRERNQQPTAALPERIETWWRMKGPSGKGLECAIYRHVSGVEAVPLPRGRLAAPQTAPQIVRREKSPRSGGRWTELLRVTSCSRSSRRTRE